jgi:BirA family biotin operon repressor/biotin-[acetyl-CoA-carboxylase] ligase
MQIKLVKQLAQANAGLTLNQLSQTLELTPLATLNLIAQINQLDPGLIQTQGISYVLSRKLNWLDSTQISAKLAASGFGYCSLVIRDNIDSTNSYALRESSTLASDTIISCEWQHAGRGRFGRHWVTPIARDITLSIVLTLEHEFNLSLLPIITAVAVNRVYKNHQIASKIKWPNDIYQAESKIAGILVENVRRQSDNFTVIGIGFTNLHAWERNNLVVELYIALKQLISEYQLIGFATLRREWLDNCLHWGRQVNLYREGQLIASGIHRDLNPNGELVIATSNGLQVLNSSAISLKVE